VAVDWVPYELHPEIPKEGVDPEAVLPAGYRDRAEAGMRRMAEEAGLRMASHDRLINSRPALQAAEFARSVGRYEPMHQELFRAYWDAGDDISALPILRAVATRASVDPDAMETAIAADTYGDYLDARRQEAEHLMITGIPAHVIADRYLVMGAQPYDTFERVMERLNVPRRLSA
jgi:predicted DsbA family dithiol-disulfide isomerase